MITTKSCVKFITETNLVSSTLIHIKLYYLLENIFVSHG